MRVSDFSIGQRLASGFVLILSLSMLIMGIALWRLHASAQETQLMMSTPLSKERMSGDWYTNISVAVRRTSAIAKSSDTSLVSFFSADQAEISQSTTKLQKGIEALIETPDEKGLFNNITAIRKQYLEARDKLVTLKKDGNVDQAEEVLNKVYLPLSKTYLSNVHSFQVLQRHTMDALAAHIKLVNDTSSTLLLSVGGMMLVLGTWCACVVVQ